MATSEGSGSQVRLGVSPLSWTNDVLVELGGDVPLEVCLQVAAAYPDKFLQIGIAEQNFVGVAVGLASVGFVPWLSTFTVFFTHRAIDPIRMLVAQTKANVKLGAAYAGLLTGLTGKTHQDVEDIAIMRDARHDGPGSRGCDRGRSHFPLGH
jgi:transketolase